MDTIKTAFVVALLLAVLYGVYVVLNKEQPAPPPEVASIMEQAEQGDLLAPPDIDLGGFGPPSVDPGTTNVDPAAQTSLPMQPPASLATGAPDLPAAPSQYAATQPPRTDQALVDSGSAPPTASSYAAAPSYTGPSYPEPSNNGGSSDPLTPRNAPRDLTNAPADSAGAGSVPSENYGDTAAGTAPNPPANRWSGGEGSSSTQLGPPVTDPSWNTNDPKTAPNDSVATESTTAALPIVQAMQRAQELAAENKYREALRVLSLAYQADNVSDSERQAAHELLDPLAGHVIYSREHLLLPEHVVAAGETLAAIAAKYQVPEQLLRNINAISDSAPVSAGTALKVVEGPFRAEIDTVKGELTMYVKELYAGRFPIQSGSDPQPIPGDYMVLNKQEGRTFYGRDGVPIPSHDPKNPYGSVWLDLGAGNLCIHGSPRVAATSNPQGCLSLGPRDASDVYGILSVGSRVTIRR